MNKTLITLLAVAGVTLATAGTAAADEQGFISSVESLGHYATECAGCTQDALDVGYKACASFDRGGSAAAVQAVLKPYNGPDQENGQY